MSDASTPPRPLARPAPLTLARAPPSPPASSASLTTAPRKQTMASLSSLALVDSPSPLDALIGAEHDFTVSPEASPALPSGSPPPAPDRRRYPFPAAPSPTTAGAGAGRQHTVAGRQHTVALSQTSPQAPMMQRSNTAPMPDTPSAPASRPTTPAASPAKHKHKGLRLNTVNLAPVFASAASPTKAAVSPGIKHWQQLRQHVQAPTPVEDRRAGAPGRRLGLVSKAAGRFGFRHAAETVLDQRRLSTFGGLPAAMSGLSAAERDEVARERRAFARAVKACLDACALEEGRRRLGRTALARAASSHKARSVHTAHYADAAATRGAPSLHSSHAISFDPEFSAFAPLLTELHRHLPAARAKRLWSRTCPHHAAVLAELGVAFLPDAASTDGERLQALEVFGAIVKNWAPDNAEEELCRWLWLCRALSVDDRQLRTRGLVLLASFLHDDGALPAGYDRPQSAAAFQALAVALVGLLRDLEDATYDAGQHEDAVRGLLADLADGRVMSLDEAALAELVGGDYSLQPAAGVERELVWLAVGGAMVIEPTLAPWLLDSGAAVLKRFCPPPILHATPPLILRLRAHASAAVFGALAGLVRAADADTVLAAWQAARELVVPELRALADASGATAALCELLLALELRLHAADDEQVVDPFRISTKPSTPLPVDHRSDMLRLFESGPADKAAVVAATVQAVSAGAWAAVARMLRAFLDSADFLPLGRHAVPAFISRLAAAPPPAAARPLLAYLSARHPQLFYKSLFSLSASTQPASLAAHLAAVAALSELVGPARYWTHADPHMVVVVLAGDAAPRQSKGKGREGSRRAAAVKIGRYAVAAELARALDTVDEPGGSGTRLRAFAEAVESRLGLMLEAEERDAELPAGYRALLCRLFLRLRTLTASVKRAPWVRLAVAWFLRPAPPGGDDDVVRTLRGTYSQTRSHRRASSGSEVALALPPPPSPAPTTPPHVAVAQLLVAVQACVIVDDWALVAPVLWRELCTDRDTGEPHVFLAMKCGETARQVLHDVVMSDLASARADVRASALRKLAHLFGWRFQVLSQPTIADRRGPTFHFSYPTLSFMATEIGSSAWVESRDVQDAALKKYGQTLPLELRQRLMELGWSEDASIAGEDNQEKVPISSLPPMAADTIGDRASPSPAKGLLRRASSSGSGHSLSKRRKAVFAPVLVSAVVEQAALLARDGDGVVSALSRELVRLVQREDAAMAVRPVAEALGAGDPQLALARLGGLCAVTPAFAHAALNALVGALKTRLRDDASPHWWAAALTAAARLVPAVSEMTLRDVRKNKAEHVLLPASIHEDEGGFKLHQPWRDHSLDVQTAQLALLAAVLRANPRDVYLVKKMLFNLQIQASVRHLAFARAWLALVTALFAAVNRNYTDRAELRHFLHNVAAILSLHGRADLVVAAAALRVFMLCAARFRRLFASMGFATVMRAVYETYAHGDAAARDAVEYAMRSFYRIHKDAFVYQTCVVLAEGPCDARAAYGLFASLATGGTAQAGVAAGIRGLNDREELEALVAMLSGPELSLSEIGTDAAERQAHKMAAISLDDAVFPLDNIVRLFVTAIAAHPATARAVQLFRLFAGIVPHIADGASRELLREGVEALGGVVVKGRTADDAVGTALLAGQDAGAVDWAAARREYVFLVEAYARAGGELGAATTKRTLELVVDLLRRQPESVGPAASSILRELARTRLASGRPAAFLREIAPMFRQFIAVVDFSGLLDALTELVVRSQYELDAETTAFVVHDYVEPAIHMLASAAEERMAFIVPLRASAVRLLGAAVYLRGDALGVLERVARSASLLASVVLPLALLLEAPADVDRDAVHGALWVRLLHHVMRAPPPRPAAAARAARARQTPHAVAAAAVLSLQVIKVVVVRAPESVGRVPGLWAHVAAHVLALTADADARFAERAVAPASPRVVDWMAWSVYELAVLHRTPLALALRHRIQLALAAAHREAGGGRSRPSTPGSSRSPSRAGSPQPRAGSPQPLAGLARQASSRHPSYAHARQASYGGGHARQISVSHVAGHARVPSAGAQLSPVVGTGGSPGAGGGGGHARQPSVSRLSPLMHTGAGGGGHARVPSMGGGAPRPSFADLSARRASRPVFDAFPGGVGHSFRFPSASAPPRTLPGEKGAIVHLLGPSPGAFGPALPGAASAAGAPGPPAASPVSATFGARAAPAAPAAITEVRLHAPELVDACRRAVRTALMVYGYEVEPDEADEGVRPWSAHDALHVIAEQARVFVETEFRDVFNPARTWVGADGGDGEKSGLAAAPPTPADDGAAPDGDGGSVREKLAAYELGAAPPPAGLNFGAFEIRVDDEYVQGEGGDEGDGGDAAAWDDGGWAGAVDGVGFDAPHVPDVPVFRVSSP